eukprot:748843-Hanusia_phi.AAC.2
MQTSWKIQEYDSSNQIMMTCHSFCALPICQLLLALTVNVASTGASTPAVSPSMSAINAGSHKQSTDAKTISELKLHHLSQKSDKEKRSTKPSLAHSDLDSVDPAAAVMSAIAPQDAPSVDSSGRVVDSGHIGADGKRTGQLAEPPSFMFPIVVAIVGSVLMVIFFVYMCFFKEEKPKKKGDTYS